MLRANAINYPTGRIITEEHAEERRKEEKQDRQDRNI